jgi:RimJ/RimL family protein N-acetyltransferase
VSAPDADLPLGPLAPRIPLSIATPRLRLRFPREDDWRALHAYFGDEESVRYTTRRAFTEAETWRAVAGVAGHWALRGHGPYVITERARGDVLGLCGPWFPNDWPEPQIKWSLVPAARGQGVAREAARAVLAMAGAFLRQFVPISLILAGNARSIALARALGARFERDLPFRGETAHVYRHAAPPTVAVRPATAADAPAVADVYLRSRKTHVAFAPLAHADDEVRRWIARVLLPSGGCWVAVEGERVVALLALSRDARGVHWIDSLYVDLDRVGGGIGAALMAVALREGGRPLRLFTFAQNQGARRFYERYGFVPLAFGDGSANEEGRPDVLYELPD